MIVIIKKGRKCESCRFQVLMMPKRIHLIMIVIIIKRKNVNHPDFDDVEKNSLDNDCHHKKGREFECMNREFWWCQSRIKQVCFNKYSKVKHCFKINSRSSKQDQEKDKVSNNLIGWLVFTLKQIFFKRSKALVINYHVV